MQFRVKYTYTFNGNQYTDYTNEVETYSKYSVLHFISIFQAQMNQAWEDTKTSTESTQAKWEYGISGNFNGFQNIPQSYYTYSSSASVACGQTALLLNTPSEPQPFGTVGTNGAVYTIGIYHTHPSFTYCSPNESLISGPSIDVDLKPENLRLYPRVVRVFPYTINGGHNMYLPTQNLAYGLSFTNY